MCAIAHYVGRCTIDTVRSGYSRRPVEYAVFISSERRLNCTSTTCLCSPRQASGTIYINIFIHNTADFFFIFYFLGAAVIMQASLITKKKKTQQQTPNAWRRVFRWLAACVRCFDSEKHSAKKTRRIKRTTVVVPHFIIFYFFMIHPSHADILHRARGANVDQAACCRAAEIRSMYCERVWLRDGSRKQHCFANVIMGCSNLGWSKIPFWFGYFFSQNVFFVVVFVVVCSCVIEVSIT